jgi:serine/threonine protein kinase
MTLEPGTILNSRYRIEAIIAKGGMSSIYRATDTSLGVQVAVKENAFASEEYSRQFRREAVILAGLRHPNLPRVTDHFVIEDQGQYLVMDFIDGEDLRERLRRQGTLPEEEVRLIGITICTSLNYLHSLNPPIFHRDIKPGNIKITPAGQIYLVDFGLAKVAEDGESTTVGAQSLTPGYAPPEQYGHGTDVRSDIYSLGATLYAALTGKIPEDGISRAMGNVQLTHIRRYNSKISIKTALAIEHAMAVDPNQRYQTALEFKTALQGESSEGSRLLQAVEEIRITPPPPTEEATSPVKELRDVFNQNTARLPINNRFKSIASITAISLGLVVFALAAFYVASGFLGKGNLNPSSQTQAPNNMTVPTLIVSQKTAGATSQTSQQNSLTATPVSGVLPAIVSTPIGSGNGKIAFASDRNGDYPQIFVMDPDGTNVHQITDVTDGACQPSWSPDGRRIVFISPCDSDKSSYPNSSLYIINVNQTGLLPLDTVAGGDYDPAWSPDGTQIAFTSLRNGHEQLFLYNLSDDSVKRLSKATDYDSNPAWSPDGKTLAYEHLNETNTAIIMLMNVESGTTQVFSSPEKGNTRMPRWSWDGKSIVFSQGPIQPWLVIGQVAGTGFTDLGFRPARNPSFSPDDSWIVCSSNGDIFRVDVTGKDVTSLTEGPANDFTPAWQP